VALYWGTGRQARVGQTLKARTKEGWFRKEIEDAMEAGRPEGVPSRLSSFFLVDDPSLVGLAGGSTDYVYRVAPIGVYSKHHQGWMGNVYDAMMPFIRHGASQGEKDAAAPLLVHIGEWVHNYWEGISYQHRPSQAKNTWEFLAPMILIEEEV
jgi:hypothetical protein